MTETPANTRPRGPVIVPGVLLSRLCSYLMLIAIVAIVFVPLLIVLFASFKTPEQIGSTFAMAPPTQLMLSNYATVFEKGKLAVGFRTSSLLVIAALFINLMIGSMTAYAMTRFDFKLKKVVFGIFLLGMIMPQFITEISRFQVISKIGLYNTIWAPIVIYAASDLMQLYIYTQFLEKIPRAVDESAMIDGAGLFRVYLRIIVPLLRPAIATVAIIKSVDVINDMYIPYLYMKKEALRTLTTTLMQFSASKYSNWSTLSAAIICVMLPTLILYILFQRQVFEGIVAGTVKE